MKEKETSLRQKVALAVGAAAIVGLIAFGSGCAAENPNKQKPKTTLINPSGPTIIPPPKETRNSKTNIIDNVVKEIDSDFIGVLGEEAYSITDEEMEKTTFSLMQVIPSENQLAFIQGAMATHKILKVQYDRKTGGFPKLYRSAGLDYLEDTISELEKNEDPISLRDLFKKQGNELIVAEPDLGQAIRHLSGNLKTQGEKDSFYGGAATVYKLLKDYSQDKKSGKPYPLPKPQLPSKSAI